MHSTTLSFPSPSTPAESIPARDPVSAALEGFFNLLDEVGSTHDGTAVREEYPAHGAESAEPAAKPREASASASLKGRRIAILATEGFEQSELEEPRKALKKAGAKIDLVSIKAGRIRGWAENRFCRGITVDLTLDQANAEDYDGLLLPGGVMNPDKLRMEPKAVAFTRAFFDAHKPVAAICHGPQLLIEADVVRGRRVTSYPSVRVDLINAGASWVDEAVVVDLGLVTSRTPEDLPEFNAKMIEEFAEGKHPAP